MEDDEEVSNMDEPSIQVDNKEVENLPNVSDNEQCETVHESKTDALENDVGDAIEEKEDLVKIQEIERRESVSELDGSRILSDSEAVVAVEGGDVEDAVEKQEGDIEMGVKDETEAVVAEDGDAVEDKAGEVQKLVKDETELGFAKDADDAKDEAEDTAGDLQKLVNNEKCEPVTEGDDSKVVGESESAAPIDTGDIKNMVEDKEEELPMMLPDSDECEAVPESDDSKMIGESGLAVGKDEDGGASKQEVEEIPEAVPDLDGSQPVSESEVAAVKEKENDNAVAQEEETSRAVSELSDSQLGQESEHAASMEDSEVPIAEEEAQEVRELDDSQLVEDLKLSAAEEEDEEDDMIGEEHETPTADTEMETEMEVTEVGRGGGKRKRGKSSRVPVRARKTVEEDVCFICFDGGDLVLCDRRGCPKAYHPSCVNRDEAFFKAKGRWNCGWHLCSICEKNAYYMCYTCTYSLCKGCIKDSVILCVRGNKGFCETCMKTVMLIEKNELGNGERAQVDFDDKSSWEYLFKDYWLELKGKLLLTSEELAQAKNPWKKSDVHGGKQGSADEVDDANNNEVSGSDNPSGNKEASAPRRRKLKKGSKSLTKEENSASASDSSRHLDASKSKRRKAKKRSKSHAEGSLPSAASAISAEGTSMPGRTEWASKELLEFVMHMKDGDTSILSQFDVQALLLEYIKINKLRDPRRKSQIICDLRLQNLFGKQRVGHFEMLKLLESHFLIREDSQGDDLQGTIVDTETSHLDAEGSTDTLTKVGKDRKRKARRKSYERELQSNLDDYAAIDIHNINLVYLRRSLMEVLLEDPDNFPEKVVGSFARIRITGSNQKQEMYRLVQVVGTSKADQPYKVGKRTTDITLEIQNLDKTEAISIDIVSNQEFTEDECKRLRQSIKLGLINRLTLGDVQEKAMALQEVRVNDWLETEVVRLSHLRDRASETGRRKELRECVEKLQRLKTPEERQRRLEEIPEVHSDPNMDPSYESEEDEVETDNKKQENNLRPRGSGYSRRGRDPASPRKGSSMSNDSWSGTRNSSSTSRELSRNLSSRGFSNRREDAMTTSDIVNENTWSQERNRDRQQLNSWERQKPASTSEIGGRNSNTALASESFSGVVPEPSPASLSPGFAQPAQFNETEKLWLYRDPAGKVQGPFSMTQLRKWSNTGYFPKDLRIWRNAEKQDDSILLTEAMKGNFQKESALMDNNFSNSQRVHSPHLSSSYAGKPYGTTSQSASEGQEAERSKGRAALAVEGHSFATNGWNSDHVGRNDVSNLPSPTPSRSTTGERGGQASEYKFSPSHFSVQTASASLTPQRGQLSHLSTPPSDSANLSGGLDGSNVSFAQQTNVPVNKEYNGIEYSGVAVPSSLSNSGRQLIRGSEHESYSSHQAQPEPVLGAASVNPGADSGGLLPNMVHSVTTHNPPIESHGWSSGSVAQTNPSPMAAQQPAYGHWGNASSSIHGSASTFSTGNPGGNILSAGVSGLPSSDSWRPSVPVNQANMQPPAPPNQPWPMGITENVNTAPSWGPMQGNQNMGWGGPVPGNTNMNWGPSGQVLAPGNSNLAWSASGQGPVPGTPNPNWVPSGQGPAPGNSNPNWVTPGQGPAPGNANPNWVPPGNAYPGWVAPPSQVPAPGNTHPGWVVPGQGPAPGITNPGWTAPVQGPAPGNAQSGWIPPGQGPPPGNSNQGWVAPNVNQSWGSEQQNHNGDNRSQRDRSLHGGDSGSGGGRAWNRQSSFGSGGGGGGGSSRSRVCDYHMNGHCRKGSSCDYLHP